MKIKSTFGTLILVWMMVVSLLPLSVRSQVAQKQTAAPKPQDDKTKKQFDPNAPKFALLVSINKYKAGKDVITELSGAENDTDLMFDLLVQDYGFDKNNIEVLKGANATADNIRKGFDRLIQKALESKKANKEAIIVFHYSGHGSQVPNQPDDKDDEQDDGKDETIVPYDSRQGGIHDIRDDELDDYFAELSQSTPNITLIFDSCHSGTASRGDENLIARLVDDDKPEKNPYKPKSNLRALDRAGKYVTLSAAASYQRAYERDKRRPNEKPHGTFTYYLVQALKRASRATTNRELIQEISVGVKNEIPSGQDPQVEGNIDNFVFGGAANRAEPYITIKEVDAEKGEITFNAGQVHGVKPGSLIAIYASSATEYKGTDGFVTNAVVKEKGVKVNNAIAVLPKPSSDVEAKKLKQIDKLSKVVLLSPNFGGSALRVDLSGGAAVKAKSSNALLKDEIAKNLTEMKLIESDLVKITNGYDAVSQDENDSPLISLKRDKFRYAFPQDSYLLPLKDEAFCNAPTKPKDDEEIIYLTDGTNRPIFGYYARPNEVGADEIARVIDLYARQRNLLALSNNSSKLSGNIKVTMEYHPGTYTKKCEDGEVVKMFEEDTQSKSLLLFDSNPEVKAGSQKQTELGLNQVFEIKIKNTSKQLAYVTAIIVGADGSIQIVYPEGGNAQASLIRAGEEVSIGKRITTAPLGSEKVVVFITKKATDFSFLEVEGVRRSKGDASMLEKILTRSGIVTSRSEAVGDSPDEWGTVKLELVVAEKTKTDKQ